MIKRMAIMLILVALVFGGVFGFQASMIRKFMAQMSAPPQTVSTTVANKQDWQQQIEAVGSLRAVKGADLSLEVAGVVDSISFNSGDDVREGAELLRLRAQDDIARLKSLQAVAELNAIIYARDERQLKANAISQAQVDTDAANLKNARAQVDQQQAIIDKKTLRAPFTGHLGLRLVDLGQYLAPGTMIVTLQALDPIYVDFFLPQQAVDRVKFGQAVNVKVDAYPDSTFAGETAINPKIDAATRNVQVRATLNNTDRKLFPGMYATIEVATGAPQPHITLPQTAVTYNPYGETVYVVDDKGRDAEGEPQLVARQTFVTTGPTRGDQVAILTGLSGGETVVTAGQIKLHNGSAVVVNNAITPTADAAPLPVDQ